MTGVVPIGCASARPCARALRDGVAVEIDSTAVVPGDAVLLAAGSLIPADTIYPPSGIEPTLPDG